jgi:16S rRNA (adenine1518-N6/adenine1519-N6)-dimethyltransferase
MADRIAPKKSLGQHFLTDRSILGGIVDLARLVPGEDVVEIGPGPGGLTRELLERGHRVLAVEIDSRMGDRLRADLGGEPGFHLRLADALEADFPRWLEEAAFRMPVAVLGNFPYNVGTALVRRLLPQRGWLRVIAGLLQEEVVRRLAARPGTPDYGYLTLYTAFYAAAAAGPLVRPGAFHPPPRVRSRMFRLDLHPDRLLPPAGEARYLALVSAAFAAPRKTLLNNLRRAGWSPEALAGFLSARGLPADTRPAGLPPEAYLELAQIP